MSLSSIRRLVRRLTNDKVDQKTEEGDPEDEFEEAADPASTGFLLAW